mgnify:FL=1
MSAAYKCDRCGVFFEPKDVVRFHPSQEYVRGQDGPAIGYFDFTLTHMDGDVCASCLQAAVQAALASWVQYAEAIAPQEVTP